MAKSDPTALVELAERLHAQSDLVGSLQSLESAVRELRAQGLPSKLGDALNRLGMVRRELGNFDEALAAYREARECARQSEDRFSEAEITSNLGTLEGRIGHYREAVRLLTEADALAAAEHSERADQLLWNIRNSVANVHMFLGDMVGARAYWLEVLKLVHGRSGENNLERSILTNLGVSHARTGETSKAQEYFDRALQLTVESDLPARALIFGCGGCGRDRYPLWEPNARRLFFVRDGALMSVSIDDKAIRKLDTSKLVDQLLSLSKDGDKLEVVFRGPDQDVAGQSTVYLLELDADFRERAVALLIGSPVWDALRQRGQLDPRDRRRTGFDFPRLQASKLVFLK